MDLADDGNLSGLRIPDDMKVGDNMPISVPHEATTSSKRDFGDIGTKVVLVSCERINENN